ncbi:hypothetical protein FIV37_17605 [Pseudomonas gessardii]|nr:hypothetical protein [Pseudomonas gessardii]
MIVPTLCVGTPLRTLCVRCCDAERHGVHSHAERGNDHPQSVGTIITAWRSTPRWTSQTQSLHCQSPAPAL